VATTDQAVQPNIPSTETRKPRPRRSNWAPNTVAIGTILAICYFAEQTLAVILISVLVAFILAPAADLLMRLRLPRWVAAAISVGLLLAVIGGTVFYGFNQASKLIEQLPQYTKKVRDDLSRLARKTKNLEVLSPSNEKGVVNVHQTTSMAELLTKGFGSFTEVMLAASFIPFLVFFMLTWEDHARDATVGLFPPDHRRDAYRTLGLISNMVRGFMVGNLLIGLLIGALSTVVFGLLGVPFFFFAGFASGFLSLIPALGVIFALLPPLFLGVGQMSLTHVMWIVLTTFALHVVSINVLYPKFLGPRLRLNPLAVTIALLVWAWLWGAIGLVLAIPITAGMKIVFDHVESLKALGVWLGESSKTNGGKGGEGASR
jgi:predicted PurR-regulated permease PerM